MSGDDRPAGFVLEGVIDLEEDLVDPATGVGETYDEGTIVAATKIPAEDVPGIYPVAIDTVHALRIDVETEGGTVPTYVEWPGPGEQSDHLPRVLDALGRERREFADIHGDRVALDAVEGWHGIDLSRTAALNDVELPEDADPDGSFLDPDAVSEPDDAGTDDDAESGPDEAADAESVTDGAAAESGADVESRAGAEPAGVDARSDAAAGPDAATEPEVDAEVRPGADAEPADGAAPAPDADSRSSARTAARPRAATLADRAVAFGVDALVLSVVVVPVWAGVVLLQFFVGGGVDATAGPVAYLARALLWSVVGLLAFGYFAVLDGTRGGTAGKRIRGLRVAGTDGATASPGAAAVRTAVLLAPLPTMALLHASPWWLGVGLGLEILAGWLLLETAVATVDPRNQRLGDKFAGTVVVEDE